jgi:hypothetical protein
VAHACNPTQEAEIMRIMIQRQPGQTVHKRKERKKQHWLRVKRYNAKRFSMQMDPQNRQVAILTSDKVDFRLKSVRRNNEGHINKRNK